MDCYELAHIIQPSTMTLLPHIHYQISMNVTCTNLMWREVNRHPCLTHCIVRYMLLIHKSSIHIYNSIYNQHILYMDLNVIFWKTINLEGEKTDYFMLVSAQNSTLNSVQVKGVDIKWSLHHTKLKYLKKCSNKNCTAFAVNVYISVASILRYSAEAFNWQIIHLQ